MSNFVDPDEQEIVGLKPNGMPDPAYAVALGLVPASPGLRSLAFAIDLAIVLVLAIPSMIGVVILGSILTAAKPPTQISDLLFPLILVAAGELLITMYYILQLVLHGLRGLTVGKAACGIRSVRVTTFARPGFWRMVLRAIIFAASFIVVPFFGGIVFLLSPLWDPEKRGRGWLDRICGNWLVNVRRGLDPYDAKALRLARKRVAAPQQADVVPLPSLATGAGAPTFVPGTRSSSGVVGAAARSDALPAPSGSWSPPQVGPASPPVAAAASATAVAAAAPAIPAAPVVPASPTTTPAVSPTTTVAPAHPAETEMSAASTTVPPAATNPTQSSAATLVFDDGTQITVTGSGLLGRNPQPREGEYVAQLIPVHDDLQQISKTHLEFGFDDRGLWVSDRSSVNGTRVTTVTGARTDVPVGAHYPVNSGSVVEIGGRTFRVVYGESAQTEEVG